MARTRIIVNGDGIESIVRFDKHQIAQHWLLIISEMMLLLTGLPQKFATWAASQWWINVLGGMENVRIVHRIGAYLMIALCVYHVIYLLYSILVL
ncbi:MAG: DUF4405 domain-containing protein, partial [Chloroflexi bacterium]|nr:DUF4405 domain-containing protein [Chloroflexota bacterium]